jgi:hypothetical protein
MEYADNVLIRLVAPVQRSASAAHERESETQSEACLWRVQTITNGAEIGAEEEGAWYLRRLPVDGGFSALQTVDHILPWKMIGWVLCGCTHA